MNNWKSFGSHMAIYAAGLCFFLTASSYALFSVINAENLKQTLNEVGTYDNLVPSVLSTARYDIAEVGQLPLQAPWVKEAAQKAFPASDLEQKGNTAIDGTFRWLEGETNKPEFQLDFTDNKQRLAEELGSSAENRLAGLPRCARLVASIDAFNIDCLPAGVSPNAIGERLTAQYAQDENFLKETVITPDSFSADLFAGTPNEAVQTPKINLEGFRNWYKNSDLLKWLLPVLTVLFAVVGVYLAADRTKGVRRLARTFMGGAIGLAVFALVMAFGVKTAINTVSSDVITQEIASPVLLSLVEQARTVYFIFAAIGLLLAMSLLGLSKRFGNR